MVVHLTTWRSRFVLIRLMMFLILLFGKISFGAQIFFRDSEKTQDNLLSVIFHFFSVVSFHLLFNISRALPHETNVEFLFYLKIGECVSALYIFVFFTIKRKNSRSNKLLMFCKLERGSGRNRMWIRFLFFIFLVVTEINYSGV